jgi:hypothetical protein
MSSLKTVFSFQFSVLREQIEEAVSEKRGCQRSAFSGQQKIKSSELHECFDFTEQALKTANS